MNRNLGLLGRKLGNTQIFTDAGSVVRVTAIEAGPCVVLGKRTQEKHGYSALELGFGEKRASRVRKPQSAVFAKLDVKPVRFVREFRLPAEVVAKYEVGQTIRAADVFEDGQRVDVVGTTKGRGFTGVMKRHNFRGAGTVTHGTHEYKRHGGAIGTNMTPGRTLPNLKMAGQYGNERVTILNLRVAKVVADDDLVLLEGAVPGPRKGLVTVRATVKAPPKGT